MSHWQSDYDRFTRPRMSERKLFWFCLLLVVIGITLAFLVPGAWPEPGYPKTVTTRVAP